MTTKIYIDCSRDFKKSAEYVFDTFFAVMGVPYKICKEPGANIDIYYGNNQRIGLINIPVDDYKKWLKNKPSVKWLKGIPLLYIHQEPIDLFDCDFIAASFYLLSRQEEYLDHRRDIWDCFSGNYTILREMNLLEFPVINSYIKLIKELLQIQEPFWKDGKEFAVALTHDVDRSFKWDFRTGFKNVIVSPTKKFAGLKSGILMGLGDLYKIFSKKEDPHLSFKNWSSLEDQYGFKSAFYFIPLTEKSNNAYDRHYINHQKISKIIQEIYSKGWEVGVHGSYDSYRNSVKLQNEKNKLEKILGDKVIGLRQHYLRFESSATWKVQYQAGFLYDTTLGYNEAIGFRAGIAFPFYPYDFETQSRIPILELPLTIMDGVLFDEEQLDVNAATERCTKLIKTTKEYNGLVTLLWHPHYWSETEHPDWRKTYENILEYLSKENVWVTSPREIAEWWLNRCSSDEK